MFGQGNWISKPWLTRSTNLLVLTGVELTAILSAIFDPSYTRRWSPMMKRFAGGSRHWRRGRLPLQSGSKTWLDHRLQIQSPIRSLFSLFLHSNYLINFSSRCIDGITAIVEPFLDLICAHTRMVAYVEFGGPEPADDRKLNIVRCVSAIRLSLHQLML